MIMRRIASRKALATFLAILAATAASCSARVKSRQPLSDGTSGGNPRVELNFRAFQNFATSQQMTVCPTSLELVRDGSTAVETVALAAQDLSVPATGIDFGQVQVPAGTYTQIRLGLSPACASGRSLRYVNSQGSFETSGAVKLQFSGFIKVEKGSARLEFRIQPQIDALNTVASATELVSKAEAPSGSFSSTELTPDGRPVCSAAVHDQYRVVGPDGQTYPSWHPQVDPTTGCVFGHEHGSDPRSFAGYAQTGMPAFGYAAAKAGRAQSNEGYKVFVVNDDGRGKSWMVTVHQGTGDPGRAAASERYHEVSVFMRDNASGELLARVYTLADFGQYASPCAATRPDPARFIPTLGCSNPYESWDPVIAIGGGIFQARPSFGVDNPTTRVNAADLGQLSPNLASACGPADPFGWDSWCKGDVRKVTHPRWVLNNSTASDTFHTDAYGALVAGPGPTSVAQMVRASRFIDESADCCGSTVVYILDSPVGGGAFVRQDRSTSPLGQSVNFEFGGYTVRWRN